MRQELFGPLHEQFESQFGFPLRPKQPFLGGWFLWLSVCSVWRLGYGGKVGGQEGAEGFTPKSIPLQLKTGIFRREKMATHMLLLPISLVLYRTGLVVKQYYT